MSDAPAKHTKVKHGKPRAFYDVFSRKGEGQVTTHYCPGCGHGTAAKLIAEAIDTLGVQDRVIFLSPVGCTVFAYYYFDCGNIQCAHGRAPSVATGVRRTLDDAIVISYQGDGDLAGIGMGSIVHAANRGENITVFFVNNAIYGMTGGQTAPTTLIGQKTVTSPAGRSVLGEGYPIRMAELIDTLDAPVLVERVSLASASQVVRARKVFLKALENQVHRKGFSFVEVLSACPVNWRMSPTEALKWMKECMEPVFPVRNFRDRGASAHPMPAHRKEVPDVRAILPPDHERAGGEKNPLAGTLQDQMVVIAGFGGQGATSAGMVLAKGATIEGFQATWLPSYGPEMRGGTAHASVIISREMVGSPVISHPNVLLAVNRPSLDAFENEVSTGGMILVNSTMVDRKVLRKDVKVFCAPATQIATEMGSASGASVVMLAIYLAMTGVVRRETLRKVIAEAGGARRSEAGLKTVEAAYDYYAKNRQDL